MNRRPRPHGASGILLIALMTTAGADGQTRSATGAAGAGEVTITAGVVTADRFHRQGFSVDGPLERKTTISVDTTVNATSKLAIHVGTGWGAFYAASGGSPTGLRDSHHGRQDTTLGLTWRMDGRTPGHGPTGSVKIGGRLPGPYDAGYTNSLGDGATELQGSVAVESFESRIGWITEIGYRRRTHAFVNPAGINEATTHHVKVDVPNETFAFVGTYGRINDRVSVGITRGKAEDQKTGPGSTRPEARERQPPPSHQPAMPANRVFVIGADGRPLAPCTIQRARRLIKAGRVRKRDYNPFTIHLKDRVRDDYDTSVHDIEVRVAPGSRRTGVAVVLKLDDEDRVLYREEIEHRADISRRLTERKGHRRRRRSTKWYRAPRFDNRRRPEGWLPPTIESIVSNQEHRTIRLARRSGAPGAVVQTGKFDTRKILDPAVKGKEYQRGPLYKTHLRAYAAERDNHRCAYCNKGDWKDGTPFNLDHVVPRSAGGPTNVRNVVWCCRPCNERKAAHPVEDFLRDDPKRLAKVRGPKRPPLAAAGQYAVVCRKLLRRLTDAGLDLTETTGADTAHQRKELGIPKSRVNDAACCGSTNPVTRLRMPEILSRPWATSGASRSRDCRRVRTSAGGISRPRRGVAHRHRVTHDTQTWCTESEPETRSRS